MKKLISRKFTRAKPVAPNKKKEHKPHNQSPSNSRSIPERFFSSTNRFIFFVCFVSGVLLMVLLLQENTIRLNILALQSLSAQRAAVQKQLIQWQKVVSEHPDYRDGYFQLAILEYKLGDMNKAYIYDEDALQLDPNFKSGRNLEKKL